MAATLALLGFFGNAAMQPAFAQDEPREVAQYPIDIELLRPTFSTEAVAGMDAATIRRQGTIVVGTFVQYERSPLRLFEFEHLVGRVVSHRFQSHIGFSFAPTKRFGARIVLPMGANWDSQVPELAGDGFGVGDLSAGVRWYAGTWKVFSLGVHADLLLPNGSRKKYFGETRPRSIFGVTGTLDFGRVDWNTQLDVHVRSNVRTDQDLIAGSELLIDTGVSLELRPQTLYLDTTLFSRLGFAKFLSGGGENSLEGLVTVRSYPSKWVRLDLGIGRGISSGYGTTEVRVLGGVSFQRVPEPPPIATERVTDWTDLPEDLPDIEVAVNEPKVEEPTPDPTALAHIEYDQIVIKDPIQFKVDTPEILSPSLPTLHYVAKVMNDNGWIGHLVIEGHASVEGEFDWNYDLSVRRAKAIFEELIKAGVHPTRMSYRGMGEVQNVEVGEEEVHLAPNRRVQFFIVRQYAPGDKIPDLDTRIRLPWNGQGYTVQQPNMPAEPAPRIRVVPAKATDLLEGTDTAPIETPPTEKPPVETPPTEKPPVETPPTEKPPVEKPPVETPPAEKPPEDGKTWAPWKDPNKPDPEEEGDSGDEAPEENKP